MNDAQQPIVLGSSSPYRQQLLQTLGLRFTTCSPDIDETPAPGESPEQLVARLALEKARAVAAQHPNALIIASDQVSVLDGNINGKPGTLEKATRQLEASSGKTVTFLTSLCVFDAAEQTHQLDIVPFKVHFRQLSPEKIARYLQKEQPLQCAGAFKSEGLGISLFEKLEGDDPNSLIGLPLIRLVSFLEQKGIQIP
ncbi:MAG: nucleoside triphosphate pyrophosphatase [Ketobacteraceae bacterium]|nr:nucleoside triphosphate pyrophosphatase [Ketobacteraceae bacterium]